MVVWWFSLQHEIIILIDQTRPSAKTDVLYVSTYLHMYSDTLYCTEYRKYGVLRVNQRDGVGGGKEEGQGKEADMMNWR